MLPLTAVRLQASVVFVSLGSACVDTAILVNRVHRASAKVLYTSRVWEVLPYNLILVSRVVALQVKVSFKDVILLVDNQGNVGHSAVVALVVFTATCTHNVRIDREHDQNKISPH